LNRGEKFKLPSNIKHSGNFDDVVYKADDREYLMQLKHSCIPEAHILRKGELKFLLSESFKSYCYIKNERALKGETIDNSEFIIYTNRDLTEKLSKHEKEKPELDIFFTTCKDKVFKFKPDGNKNIDVYTLLLGNSEEKSESEKDMVSEFLKKLIMATGQKGHFELDELIPNEIRIQDAIQGEEAEYKPIFHHFKTLLENWWRNTQREDMIPEILRNWLQRAKTEHFAPTVTSFYNSCTMKLVRTGIKFSGSKSSRFKERLSNSYAVHLRSDAPTLCSILLLDCLDTSKCIFVTFELLQSSKNLLLHAWLGGHWEWLIVFCDSAVRQSELSGTCPQTFDIFKCAHLCKRLIILTAYSGQPITDFDFVEHKFKFEQLSQKSQEMVLDKKIDFQGCEVTLRIVLQRMWSMFWDMNWSQTW
jgi:hypothetical protein